MAEREQPRVGTGTRHLDATGPREVVYCHMCENEWHKDEHGLVCPRCEGEITEIVSPDSDPRPLHDEPPPRAPSDFRSLHDHDPWADGNISDPEEADIEEHVTHGPGGSVSFTRTFRSGNLRGSNRGRGPLPPDDPDHVLRDFQNMVGNMVGPGFRAGQPGRSGRDTLFPQGPFGGSNTFLFGGNGNGNGPRFVGGRVTFTTGGGLRPREPNGPQPGGPQVDPLATILGSLFGPPGAAGDPNERNAGIPAGMPPGLATLFQAMLNPANARSGDAVYTQEALDSIISQLMEQHPTSNAPGPAPPDAIASLPKKKIDEKMLGPEGKAECSVCMDDVHMGDEVVALPCSHWFHEACASAWLSEHNTCPICRKGIDSEPSPASNTRRASQAATPSSGNERQRRFGSSRENSNTNRNEARLDSIRNARYSPTEESSSSRWQATEDGNRAYHGSDAPTPPADDFAAPMPGSFHRGFSDMSENQRDTRRTNTSGSDRSSRGSRRSSQSGGSGNGPVSWFRDRFGSNRRND